MNKTKHFWRQWILHNSVGELLAIAIASLAARFVFVGFFGNTFTTSSLVFVILIICGAIEGSLSGFIQWRSFARLFPGFKAISWMLVTVGFTIAAWLFILPPAVIIISLVAELRIIDNYPLIYSLIIGIGFGAMISLPQVVILKKYYSNSLYWVSANIAGWMFSFVTFYFAINLLPDASSLVMKILLIAIACIFSGFVQGLLTGLCLHYLMTKRGEHAITVSLADSAAQ